MYLNQHVRKSHEQGNSSGLKKQTQKRRPLSQSRPLIRNEGFGVGGRWRTWVKAGQGKHCPTSVESSSGGNIQGSEVVAPKALIPEN